MRNSVPFLKKEGHCSLRRISSGIKKGGVYEDRIYKR